MSMDVRGEHADRQWRSLERLIEQDRDLMDGVIPYDPPQNPPTSPSPGGTSFTLASCQYPAGLHR